MRPVGIAVTVFPVPADFEGGLDAMIQPVAEVLYVNQAMGEPLYPLSLAQRGQELLAVMVVPEDILALVPTAHDVIHGPGILNAQLTRHGQPLPTRPGGVNSED